MARVGVGGCEERKASGSIEESMSACNRRNVEHGSIRVVDRRDRCPFQIRKEVAGILRHMTGMRPRIDPRGRLRLNASGSATPPHSALV